MASRNPVLGKIKAPVISDQELDRIVNGPKVQGQATLVDVIIKTVITFALVLVGAAYGWITSVSTGYNTDTMSNEPTMANTGVIFGAMIVALILGIVNAVKKSVSPALILIYALCEGVLLGAVSHWFNISYGQDIAQQAVIGTLVVFAVMLTLYKSRIIKVNGKFMKMFAVAMMSYFVIGLISFVAAIFFNVGGGWGFYGVGQIGILLCLAGVGLAAFSLVMDFEVITQVVASGVEERESWRLAFGLVVSLVWLYLELLRLLAILNRR